MGASLQLGNVRRGLDSLLEDLRLLDLKSSYHEEHVWQ
jgi:hypothetical protein